MTDFFSARWRGAVPAATVFWRDMLGVGSALNLLASFLALLLASQGAPPALAVALHFAPLPYNLFLFEAVRRSAATRSQRLVALVWFGLMLVV
jgi:hypothetical protein